MNDTTVPTTGSVTVSHEGGVAVIGFDDGKANALGHDSIWDLLTALDDVEQAGADAVVIAGRPGHFSAGFDLKVMQAGADEAREMLRKGVDLFLRCYMFPRPVVAACTGHALAAGAIILMTCDLRVGARGEIIRILDVVVEGASMSQTLRSDFGSIIRQRGGKVSGLLEELRVKTASLKADAGN